MTDKEAIEILKGIYPNGAYSPTEELRHEAINMAISALTTTQKEPACIYNRTPKERKVSCRYCSATCKERVAETASEYLEDASDEYSDKHGFRVPYDGSNNFYDKVDVKASKEGFIAGAQWQKRHMVETLRTEYEKGRYDMREEMVKEAIEGIITNASGEYGYDVSAFRFDENHTFTALLPTSKDSKHGDKVKLIIVKEG